MNVDRVKIINLNYNGKVKTIKQANEAAKSIVICDCCGYELPCNCGMSVYGSRSLYDYWEAVEKQVIIPKFELE